LNSNEYVVRVQSDFANRYSLGELVIPGVAFFREDRRNLTKEELAREIAKARNNGGRLAKQG